MSKKKEKKQKGEKMKIKKKYLKYCKRFIVLILWIIILFAIYNGYNYNKYWKEHPQTEYEPAIGGDYPEELSIKVELNNKFVTNIHIGLLLVIIYFIIDYLYDRENHFYTIYIKKWIDKIKEEGEDENK